MSGSSSGCCRSCLSSSSRIYSIPKILLEFFEQGGSRAVEPTHDRADGDVQVLGYFLVAQLLVGTKGQDGALRLVEFVNRPVNTLEAFIGIAASLRSARRLHRRVG